MSYPPKLAAGLTGATLRQLSHWRSRRAGGGAVLIPEIAQERTILYSFRDVVALRTCVKLRQETSLQKIRRALDTLRTDLGLQEHLSSYQIVADGSSIFLADTDHAVDLLQRKGHVVMHEAVDVLRPYYVQGRHVPDLLRPRKHVAVDPTVRGGEPVIAGTRVPYEDVAVLLRDGVSPEDIGTFYPRVSPEAANDALDFATYIDSYAPESA